MNIEDINLYSDAIIEWLDGLILLGKTGNRSIKVEERIKKEFKRIINKNIINIPENYQFVFERFVRLTNIADRISKRFSVRVPDKIKFIQLLYKIN